jgi:predicted RNA-binding protein with PIN domain
VPSQRVIVDGYNLMHQMPDVVRQLDADAELARSLLVRKLGEYRALHNVRVTVVFDGRGPSQLRGAKPSGVEVVYSRAPQTADDVIKRMLSVEKNPRACTVVTSDRSIAVHVRDFGARVASSAEFARELAAGGRRVRPGSAGQSEKPEMTRADVAEWEAYFRRGRA